jgi:hypothetical protein
VYEPFLFMFLSRANDIEPSRHVWAWLSGQSSALNQFEH